MASLIDSEPHFTSRAEECGVPDAVIQNLKNNQVATLGTLAFAINRPGTEFNERDFDTWATNINQGQALAVGTLAALRRLHFEAEVVVTSSFRASVESADPATPKPVPLAERTARMDAIRNRLGGLHICGPMEPSQALLDEACHQYETQQLRHIEASKCTSKENEVSVGRVEKRVKLDGNTLQIKETKATPDENISTTYQLSQCLQRRGIAYEFAGLISYESHQQYCERLLRHLSMEPPTMYNATTLQQVLRADRQVFTYMAQNSRSIRADAAGKRPLDGMLMEALRDYNTSFHLVPLPKEPWHGKADPERPRSEAYFQAAATKGKGKGKSKKGSGSTVAPKGLKGCVGRDPKNRPICFNYNLNRCDNAPAGGACNRGRHICFKAGCHKTHAFKDAHAEDAPAKGVE